MFKRCLYLGTVVYITGDRSIQNPLQSQQLICFRIFLIIFGLDYYIRLCAPRIRCRGQSPYGSHSRGAFFFFGALFFWTTGSVTKLNNNISGTGLDQTFPTTPCSGLANLPVRTTRVLVYSYRMYSTSYLLEPLEWKTSPAKNRYEPPLLLLLILLLCMHNQRFSLYGGTYY